MKQLICLLAALAIGCTVSRAQTFSVATNAVQWANLGTINAEASFAVAQHVSVGVGGRYNDWWFGEQYSERQFGNQKRTAWVGLRYWPWHVYSGWWVQLKAQYQEYDRKFLTPYKEMGDCYGGGITAGYSYMITEHFNLEFGLGGWAGYRTYQCFARANDKGPAERGQLCDRECNLIPITEGKHERDYMNRGFFVLPDDLVVSIVFIF